MKLYVDDDKIYRKPPDNTWVRAYSYKETIDFLKTNKVSHLDLDHDLGEVMDGLDIMKWLLNRAIRDSSFNLPEITFHSANVVGTKNMQGYLKDLENFRKD